MEGVFADVLPWLAFFQALYWIASLANQLSTYRSMSAHLQAYFSASVVATVHAVLVVILAVWAFSKDITLLSTDDFFAASPESLQCCHCFLGYILSDLTIALYYNKRWDGWVPNLLHHCFIVLVWWPLIDGRYGQLFALQAAICEASTPFVNMRWFLDKFDMKGTQLYIVNGLAMVFSFFVLRVIGFGWLGTKLVQQREGLLSLPLFKWSTFILGYVVGYALQLIWFRKMFIGALKTLGIIGGKKKKEDAKSK
jgi:hypothetical protein